VVVERGSLSAESRAKATVQATNQPPTVSSLEVTKGNYCTAPAHYFSWIYSDSDGDKEDKFRFQVNDGPLSECDADPSLCEVDRIVDVDLDCSSPSPPCVIDNSQSVLVVSKPEEDKLVYNTTYYWRVKVWDDQGADSGWVEGPSFVTEKHRYPSVDFNWSPQNPSAEEDVLFADQSTVYGGATKSNWSWTFEDATPASSGLQNPTVQFNSNGSKEVTLQVTDSDGYSCSDSQTVNVQVSLPTWQEILPE